jgi:hypothetical protein
LVAAARCPPPHTSSNMCDPDAAKSPLLPFPFVAKKKPTTDDHPWPLKSYSSTTLSSFILQFTIQDGGRFSFWRIQQCD